MSDDIYEVFAVKYAHHPRKAAENFIKDGTPIPAKYAFMQPMLDPIKAIKGQHLCEHKLGLTKDLEPCGFFDKNVSLNLKFIYH